MATSSYTLKTNNLGNLALPTTLGANGQYLSVSGSNTTWNDVPKNGMPAVPKFMIFSRRVRGLTNAVLSTLMIERSSVMFGSSLLGGNPNADNLYFSTVTIPPGYSGIWLFDTCGNSNNSGPGPTVIMTVTRNGTIVYNQRKANNQSGSAQGAPRVIHTWNDFRGGDVVTFQIYDVGVTTTTVSSITDTTLQRYGNFSAWWYDPNAINATNPYITSTNTTYSTGTATQSGTTINGTGVAWDASMVGGLFVFDKTTGLNRYGIITAVSPPSQITLDTAYTVASATAYQIWYGGVQISQSTGTVVAQRARLNASSNQLLLGATPNEATINATTATTINLPTISGTLFGTNTTTTLTNKTFTNPVLDLSGTLTHTNIIYDSTIGATDVTRTSSTIPLSIFTGNIRHVIGSRLRQQNGAVATGWTSSTTIITFSNVSMYFLSISNGDGQNLTYTSNVNLDPGVYKVCWYVSRTAGTAIIRFQYRVDGAVGYTVMRNYDSWTNPTIVDRLEDYFVVTTSGNPFIFQALVNSRNTSNAGSFTCEIGGPLMVYKLG